MVIKNSRPRTVAVSEVDGTVSYFYFKIESNNLIIKTILIVAQYEIFKICIIIFKYYR